MLIRTRQMDAFKQDLDKRFEQKAMEKMREYWAVDCEQLSDDELLPLVREGIATARSYELEDDNSILNFLNFRFGISHDFPEAEEHYWAKAILSDKSLSSEEKIDDVLDEIAERY